MKTLCYNHVTAVPLQAVTLRLRREVTSMFEVLVTLGVTVVGTAIGGIISGVVTYYIIKRFF